MCIMSCDIHNNTRIRNQKLIDINSFLFEKYCYITMKIVYLHYMCQRLKQEHIATLSKLIFVFISFFTTNVQFNEHIINIFFLHTEISKSTIMFQMVKMKQYQLDVESSYYSDHLLHKGLPLSSSLPFSSSSMFSLSAWNITQLLLAGQLILAGRDDLASRVVLHVHSSPRKIQDTACVC